MPLYLTPKDFSFLVEWVSLRVLGSPGAFDVDQSGLELRLYASVSQVLGLSVCPCALLPKDFLNPALEERMI